MPIPGPAPTPADAPDPAPTGSPYWLRLNGVWVQIEGIVPEVATDTTRPRSTFTSLDGNRYEQRGPRARRSWSWKLPHAASAHVAALVAAVESAAEVWLMTDIASGGNMLPSSACMGPGLPALDCGGVPLGWITTGTEATTRVRGGVPTTISFWSTAASSFDAVRVTYPGGVLNTRSAGGGLQASGTFTPSSDGTATIRVLAGPTSGLMLTEDAPPTSWLPGEAMPCPVVVDDPEDTLTMLHDGAWRHEYAIAIREVG